MRNQSLNLAAVLVLSAGLAACNSSDWSSAQRDDEARLETSGPAAVGTSGLADERASAPGVVEGPGMSADGSSGTEGAIGTSGMQAARAGMDQSFGHFAAMTNRAEIELGTLAQRKAQSQPVKEFASQLVSDHTKAMQELKRATSMSGDMTLDREHQQLYDRLSKLSGQEFDREFMKAMVEGHEKAVDRFQQAATMPGSGSADARRPTGTSGNATAASDQQLHQYAEKTLPTLRTHLQKAQQIQRNMN